VLVVRSIGLFILAAVLEIGGAWLIWQGVREHRGGIFIAGSLAWEAVADGYRPDRSDIIGALIGLVGAGLHHVRPPPLRAQSRAGQPEASQTSMTTGMIMGRRR